MPTSVTPDGATLTGKVKAPSGLISDKGGGVVSNGGGRYRLRAVEQAPLAGAVVRLLDAAGQPVADAKGQPLSAMAGPDGAYAFKAPLPAMHLVLAVTLPDGKGTLQAIAAPGVEARRQADVELVSTLTTSYILDRYVRPQADPITVLAKLPAEAERETRVRAEAALEAGQQAGRVALPTVLTSGAAADTLDVLRQADDGLDAQLVVVKNLLVVAGQIDLGNGRSATEVALGPVTGMHVGEGGALDFMVAEDRRVWRLGADGRLVATVGGRAASQGPLTGVAGVQAGLHAPVGLARDAQGRLHVLERLTIATGQAARLTRLEADGRLVEVAAGLLPASTAMVASGGELYVRTGSEWAAAGNEGVVAIAADGTVREVVRFSGDDAMKVRLTWALGRDARGRLYFWGVADGGSQTIYRWDPADGKLVTHDRAGAGVTGVMLDPRGNVFRKAFGRLEVREPDGKVTTLLESGAALGFDSFGPDNPGWLADDGQAYLAVNDGSGGVIYRVTDGVATRLAGVDRPVVASADAIALSRPAGIVSLPGGALAIVDAGFGRVWKVGADRQVTPLAGTGAFGMGGEGDGGPATAAILSEPSVLQRDAQGNLYVLERRNSSSNRIRRVAPDGTITTAFQGSKDFGFANFLARPDGTLVAARVRFGASGMGPDLVALEPGLAAPRTLAELASAEVGLALAADGAVAVWEPSRGRLSRYTQAAGLVTIDEGAGLRPATFGSGGSYDAGPHGLAYDARGRLILAYSNGSTLVRYDPASRASTPIGGAGGRSFTGEGVDDGLDQPVYPVFDGAGDLYFADFGHRQIKRVAAAVLAD